MLSKTLVALCLATASATDFKIIFENVGAKDGCSIYFTGAKEGPGVQLYTPVDEDKEEKGLEYFQSFLEAGDKNAQLSKYGSRFVIRTPDSKVGPGFRAAVQVQKGEGDFPFTFIATNIGNEPKGKSIELVHRGKEGPEAKEYLWIDAGQSVHQLTQGTQWNAFELRDVNKIPQIKMIIHTPAKDEL